jgi:hypothetical protein
VLDALGSKALKKRVEPSDGEGDPAAARTRRVRSMKSHARSPISQRASSPPRRSRGRPKNRTYRLVLASRPGAGTPAKRWMIALISRR